MLRILGPLPAEEKMWGWGVGEARTPGRKERRNKDIES